ncbi:MAG: methionyl-tRNA formyltransferase [Duncaniella sp.]|nr:methionyl-tRNA formyltransferase [Duncaniella sp.]
MPTKSDLRIVFFGTPEFAVESLRAITEAGYNVVGVVTMPDKPAGRGHKMYQSPVKEFAVAHGLTLMQPVRLKDPEFVDQLRSLDADLFVVIAFRMLPEVVWSMPPMGTFNLHGSLLPLYRGAAPINRAVMNGDTETGVTTFFLKHEIDTGDIIDRESIPVGPDDTAGDVHDRLMAIGARLTVKTIGDIVAGTLRTVPQDELTGGVEPTPAPKIFHEDCRIDWSRSAREVHNHVRGLAPYPGAWTPVTLDDGTVGEMKILSTSLAGIPEADIPEATARLVDGRLLAATGDGLIEILTLQAPGKRRMAAADYMRGLRRDTLHFG